jgi:hypothetical protein
MTSRWSDATLAAARLEGDPEADALVEHMLAGPPHAGHVGRGGYNHVLDLASMLVLYPELSLVRSSLLRSQLDAAGEISQFFDPVAAPAWVDAKKLALAGELWQTDAILAIAVLYASSLPSCYLMKKGVPALYRTEKLAEQKYVFQRIYETGLMLEAVMAPGGLKVVQDVEPSHDARIVAALNAVDPAGQWGWASHRVQRRAGAALVAPQLDAVHRTLAASEQQATRYIWGEGFIAARKVRFLHSAMRLMLMHPELMRRPDGQPPAEPPRSFMDEASRRSTAWSVEELGKPINQEDLAFVLLTFGYLIPKGMETWGREVPREQKAAFLHLWRIVGFVMGIREDLMTDDLDEAEALYQQILARNGGGSEPGQILTTAVMDFVRSYLPARMGFNTFVPAALILDQLGPDWARQILSEDSYRATRRPFARLSHGSAKMAVRAYYWLRRRLLQYLPVVGPIVSDVTTKSTDTLIDSWRDSFRRKPFYVPANATTWVPDRSVTPEYEKQLMEWRQRLFDTLAGGLASVVVSGFAAAATVVFFLMDMRVERNVSAIVAVIALALGLTLMNVTIPALARERPKLES